MDLVHVASSVRRKSATQESKDAEYKRRFNEEFKRKVFK